MISDLKIIKTPPLNWRELQNLVALVLSDCGFKTEIEKKIQTVRGEVEIDVYAEKIAGFKTIVLCECKYWDASLPQSVIHSFRTVVADSGANQGIIISKKGFQKGAYNSILHSNVVLLNWDDFQEEFRMEWLTQVIERNYKIGRELMNVVTNIISLYHEDPSLLTVKEFDDFQISREENSDFLWFTFKDHYVNLVTHAISLNEVLLRITNFKKMFSENIESLSDYFNSVYHRCNQQLNEMNSIFENMHPNI
ncbi:MAG TPA: restriction endonuclease [Hanamia sp.]|nr:restriction endonuclease [Hanamia sp.]